jgi:hypothetical protein
MDTTYFIVHLYIGSLVFITIVSEVYASWI